MTNQHQSPASAKHSPNIAFCRVGAGSTFWTGRTNNVCRRSSLCFTDTQLLGTADLSQFTGCCVTLLSFTWHVTSWTILNTFAADGLKPSTSFAFHTATTGPPLSKNDSLYEGGGRMSLCDAIVPVRWRSDSEISRLWCWWWACCDGCEMGSKVTCCIGVPPRTGVMGGDWYFLVCRRRLYTLYPKKAIRTTKRTAQAPSTMPITRPLLDTTSSDGVSLLLTGSTLWVVAAKQRTELW